MQENIFLTYALLYAEKGFHVFPLVPFSKKPITDNGFKDASISRDLIINWWILNPNANIGIATGRISGFFVVDIDGVYSEELSRLLPGKPNVKSHKGCHYYFRYPEVQAIKSRIKINGLPVDIISDGRYIVAPPSLHPDGGQYEFIT